MKETNILFTCAGRRNYLINYFKEALGGNGKIIAADHQLNAPSLIDADKAIKVPNIYSPDYIACLKSICKENKIDAIISLNDLELPILSKHKNEIEKIGTKVIVSNETVIDIAFDKWNTYKFLLENNLNSPKTYINIDKAKGAIEKGILEFPLVLKPRWGSASIAVDIVYDHNELALCYELQQSKLTRSILNNASCENLSNAILIQEMINGVEYGVDVLNDFNTKYYESFAREKLSMRSGETDKAKSVIDSGISTVGKVIAENLKHIGNLDCDMFVVDNKVYVLELNPRFGGGYPFSHEAGINTAAIYLEWINGNNDITKYNNYKPDVAFAKCDRMIKIPN